MVNIEHESDSDSGHRHLQDTVLKNNDTVAYLYIIL